MKVSKILDLFIGILALMFIGDINKVYGQINISDFKLNRSTL